MQVENVPDPSVTESAKSPNHVQMSPRKLPSPPTSTSSMSKGLVLMTTTLSKCHKRAGSMHSTGTTGTGEDSHSYTTSEDDCDEEGVDGDDDEEDDTSEDTIKQHMTRQLYSTDLDHSAQAPTETYGFSNGESMRKLQMELRTAHKELRLRDEEVGRLSRIRQDVESELEDLTASLFQEAHNMVRDANEKQAGAEKALTESQMKVDMLTAEVTALKTLVLTSTPSRPNPHLHPHIDLKLTASSGAGSTGEGDGGSSSFLKKAHRRSPSHFNLKYGRENSPPQSPVKEVNPIYQLESQGGNNLVARNELEHDPAVYAEFLLWKERPTIDKADSEFLQRVYREDIDLCLRFGNDQLSTEVIKTVENGTILIEAIGDTASITFPKKCALLEVPRQCYYRMNIGDPAVWYFISKICRNRIISVCDFFNYLKYIERGLVKSSVHDIYVEIVRLRKEMALARLGLTISS